jgi:hypothetical protein
MSGEKTPFFRRIRTIPQQEHLWYHLVPSATSPGGLFVRVDNRIAAGTQLEIVATRGCCYRWQWTEFGKSLRHDPISPNCRLGRRGAVQYVYARRDIAVGETLTV